MGLVTDVRWTCPGCSSNELAQLYFEDGDPNEMSPDAIPSDRQFKWNPPCAQCGKFKLVMPVTVVKCEAVAIDATDPKD